MGNITQTKEDLSSEGPAEDTKEGQQITHDICHLVVHALQTTAVLGIAGMATSGPPVSNRFENSSSLQHQTLQGSPGEMRPCCSALPNQCRQNSTCLEDVDSKGN